MNKCYVCDELTDELDYQLIQNPEGEVILRSVCYPCLDLLINTDDME